MKQNILRLLSCSLLISILLACSKEKLAKMDKGKYEMTHIRTLSNGQKDTFQLKAYGPYIGDDSYFFYPGVENDSIGHMEIYKIDKKSKDKKYQKIKVYLNETLIPYQTFFLGNIDSYNLDKRSLEIHYTCDEYSFSGVIQFKWIEL